MYVFYKELSPTQGMVSAVYEEHELSAEQAAAGIQVESVPAVEVREGYQGILYINPLDGYMWVEYQENFEVDTTMESLKQKLLETESKLRTASETYAAIDVNSANLTHLKNAKIAQLKEQCNQAIETFFHSPSLGYKFGFKSHDQNNMHAQTLLFLANPEEMTCEWKTEDAGVKVFTRDEFLGLLPEGKEHTRQNVNQFWTRVAQVMAAANKEAVDAVRW